MKSNPAKTEAPQAQTQTIEWSKFVAWFGRNWRQGEHVSIIGPTGRGKSTLAYAILPLRDWVVIFGTKPGDDTLEKYAKKYRFRSQSKFNPYYGQSRYLLWVKYQKPGDQFRQRPIFADAFDTIFVQRGWTLYVDETWYFDYRLKLGSKLEDYWSQSRSNYITFVAATQRPRNVPLMMYDQASHLFLFQVTDKYARDRLGEIGSIDGREVAYEVANLGPHEFLYINTVNARAPRIISEVKQ